MALGGLQASKPQKGPVFAVVWDKKGDLDGGGDGVSGRAGENMENVTKNQRKSTAVFGKKTIDF